MTRILLILFLCGCAMQKPVAIPARQAFTAASTVEPNLIYIHSLEQSHPGHWLAIYTPPTNGIWVPECSTNLVDWYGWCNTTAVDDGTGRQYVEQDVREGMWVVRLRKIR